MGGPILPLLTRTRIVIHIDPAVVLKGAAHVADELTLPYFDETQSRSNWCWATVASGVDRSYNAASTKTQCTVADLVYPTKSCCVPPPPGDNHPCNIAAALEIALGKIGRFLNFAAATADVAHDAINANKVLPIRIGWPPDMNGPVPGHFTVIRGYLTMAGGPGFVVADPKYVIQQVLESSMNGHYVTDGTWTDSYLTIGQIDDN